MKAKTVWMWTAGLTALTLIVGFQRGPVAQSVLLHWPVAIILLMGYAYHLRGGLVAAGTATLMVIGLRLGGVLGDWTLVGWQVLVYGVFGLYPFKFIQIREQRHHHYRTLIEYKRGETDSLRQKLDEVDRKCRELDQRTRLAGGGG
ncbi:MAG: hypothetical protein AAB152_14055 [Candidatus Coatesbacteria bacterium]